MCILLECMTCGVSQRSQNEAPNEAKFHRKVSFVDPAPNALYCKKFLCCISHCEGLVTSGNITHLVNKQSIVAQLVQFLGNEAGKPKTKPQ